jgi:o-succinylbenzoate synthase
VSTAVQAMDAVRQGARAVKVKIGTLGIGDEGVRLGAMRSAIGPQVGLRLDANGAWGTEAACRVARLLSVYTPDWLEQPVAAEDIEGLAAVRAAGTVPIAADESVQTMAQLEAVIAAGAADVIVIKPMFAGGLRVAAALHARATEAGLRTVFTHAMESAVGRMGTLHLVAAIAPGVAHGLGNPLGEDVAAGPVISGYVAQVPRGPGLGVTIPTVGTHAQALPRAAKIVEAQP